MATAVTEQNTEYLYPSTWTNLTDTAANYAAGFPSWANQTYQNWYNQPLSTGQTANQTTAWNAAMNPTQQWTTGVTNAATTAGQAQPYYTQAANALTPWSTTIGTGLQTLGQTPEAVNAYMSGVNQYQQLGQNAAQGYDTAQNYLGQLQGAVNPYMAGTDVLQNAAQGYTGQIGQAAAGTQAGQATVAGALPYLQQAAQGYTAGSTYNPAQLTQFLNPYTQQAANATVSDLTRNLQEKILPDVNTTFTGAGQFGSSRNKEFESRAIRDTQEAAAKALAQANYGAYTSAQQAYSDWANKQLQAASGLGTTAGQQANIGATQGTLGTQQANIINQQAQNSLQNAGLDQTQASTVANIFQNLATTQGQLTSQEVSNYLQQAGIDQTQANTVANLYPQIATSYATIGGQYGNISNAYQNLGAGQTALGSALANISQTGAGLSNQQLTNMLAAATQQQQQQQTGLTTAYEDWLKQQQFPLTTMGALGSAVGAMSAGTRPNVSIPIAQPDDVTKILAAVQAASSGLSDASVQSVLDYLFGQGNMSWG